MRSESRDGGTIRRVKTQCQRSINAIFYCRNPQVSGGRASDNEFFGGYHLL